MDHLELLQFGTILKRAKQCRRNKSGGMGKKTSLSYQLMRPETWKSRGWLAWLLMVQPLIAASKNDMPFKLPLPGQVRLPTHHAQAC